MIDFPDDVILVVQVLYFSSRITGSCATGERVTIFVHKLGDVKVEVTVVVDAKWPRSSDRQRTSRPVNEDYVCRAT